MNDLSEKWVQEHGEEQKLPGHSFTQRQLFWISHAQVIYGFLNLIHSSHSEAVYGHLYYNVQ